MLESLNVFHKKLFLVIAVIVTVVFCDLIQPTSGLFAMGRADKAVTESEQVLNTHYSQSSNLPNPLRGVFLFSIEALEDAKSTVENFTQLTAALKKRKINFIIFDMHWGTFKYENTPGIKATSKRPIDKALAGKLSKIAKDAGMTVAVAVNFLTHQSYGVLLKGYPEYAWIQKNGDTLAADPRTPKPNLWDPLNPGVNKIAFSMADELIDAFSPDVFHAGLDELWGFDADNLKSNTEGLSTHQLYAKIINQYHEHIVNTRGIPMMMWADSFEPLANRDKGLGATAVLDMIPKDIILAYWHYGMASKYPPMWTFAEKGFRVTASPWNDAKAAAALLKDASKLRKKNPNMIGVIYTIWTPGCLPDLAPALDYGGNSPRMRELTTVMDATKGLFN